MMFSILTERPITLLRVIRDGKDVTEDAALFFVWAHELEKLGLITTNPKPEITAEGRQVLEKWDRSASGPRVGALHGQ